MPKEIGEKRTSSIALNSLLALLVILYCFSLFKNISFPLVWNDESEGIMAGVHILEYGYPKVHDGKNTVISSLAPNMNVGYKEKYDANIIITWGNYYWAAIGVYLAEFTDDIYTKTALLRLPFTIMGLLGLVIFLFSARKLFSDRANFKIFLILFVFVELFSISLILHMREARYFSLVIFLSACFFYIYSEYFLYKGMSRSQYYILMTLLLFFTYHVNFIALAILSAVLVFNIGVQFLLNLKKQPTEFKNQIIWMSKDLVPVIVVFILIYPFLVFYETAKTSAAMSAYMKFTFDSYQINISGMYKFFTKLEFAYTFVIVKAVWLFLKWYLPSLPKNNKQKKPDPIQVMERYSLFATSFFLIYAIIIARTPWLFVRHYIVMQPVIVLIMITDIFIIFSQLRALQNKNLSVAKYSCIALLLVSFSLNAKNKIEYIKGHIYEMTHQYKGDLDYIIPYIQQNFKNTDSLTIATNYEEFSYMYYLRSKVTIGYVYNNLEDDLKHQPDIILYRKAWGTDPKYFNEFMQKAKYQKVTLPVADYPVNNIPELDFSIKHLFKTKLATNEQEKVDVFVRVK